MFSRIEPVLTVGRKEATTRVCMCNKLFQQSASPQISAESSYVESKLEGDSYLAKMKKRESKEHA